MSLPTHTGARVVGRLLAVLAVLALLGACGTTPDPKPTDLTPPEQPAPEPEPTPDPVDPEIIKASGIQEWEMDGLKVVLKPTPGPVVIAELIIQGGLTNTTPETDGVEELALRVASSGGTTDTPRDAFTSRLNSMGSEIGHDTDRDYSTLTMRSIRPYWTQTWELFGEVLLSPAFTDKQIELQRTRQIEEIKGIQDNPDDYVGILASQSHFDGHPYVRRTVGTEASVKKLTRDMLVTYYRGLMTRERLTLVVVGDLKRAEVEEAVRSSLATLPKGDYTFPGLPPVPEKPSKVATQVRPELPTNYMIGLFNAPAPTHPDYFPMLVATSLLSDRFFEEVRTKRNLTYAVAAGLSKRRRNYGYLYVTAVDPTTTVQVMYDEVERLATRELDPKGFGELVNVFLTEHYMRAETTAAQASLLANAEMTGGGWEQTLVFIQNIEKVTPEDVMRVTKTYIKDIHWGYIGDPSKADMNVLTSR